MPTRKSAISSNVYIAFRSLPQKGWTDIIKLYESKKKEIQLLSLSRQLDILHMYLESLHEVKDYTKLLREVPAMIYMSLSDEIPVDIGRPYYEDALFWKANAALHLMQYEEAQHILHQLTLINPEKKEYQNRLIRCLFVNKPSYIRQFRALSILFFLSAALVFVVKILVIDSFYKMYSETAETLWYSLFFSALILLASLEIIHWLYCEWKVRYYKK